MTSQTYLFIEDIARELPEVSGEILEAADEIDRLTAEMEKLGEIIRERRAALKSAVNSHWTMDDFIAARERVATKRGWR